MQNKICIRYFVSGRVQGVWYRAFAQEEANRLGLTGFARNLSDGRVEVVACGESEKLADLAILLKQGPARANVSDVISEEMPWQEYTRFGIK
ncbi:MAG TPA: acylphosphatase [Gammaproteobacteria bacterium]|nr:acylphosphatase [Gammaproteobacteria bacterium]